MVTLARRPTDMERAAMVPSRWVLFFRTFWPYQLLRFVIINIRMTTMILKSRHRVNTSAGLAREPVLSGAETSTPDRIGSRQRTREAPSLDEPRPTSRRAG